MHTMFIYQKNVAILCVGLRTAQNTISHLFSVLELAWNILNETNYHLLGMLTAAHFFAQDVVITSKCYLPLQVSCSTLFNYLHPSILLVTSKVLQNKLLRRM
jgi:hypothetical protein